MFSSEMISSQQNHVVNTIETMPPETITASPTLVQRIRKVFSRELLVTLALGQVLSLLVCGIGLTSKYLAHEYHANTPVFQSFLNYILLFLVYTTTLAVRQGEENLLAILKRRWWKYMILGLIDIEANYLVIKAYQYTTLASVQLLDCFTIPVVLLLSWFFLLVRYKAVHFVGVGVCLLGIGCMVGADVLVGRQQGLGDHKLLGDLLVLGGAMLYGISNVCEEFIVKNLSRVEFLGMMGLFGSFFSGIQLAIMEHKELLKVQWDWQIVFRALPPVLHHHHPGSGVLHLLLHLCGTGPACLQAFPQRRPPHHGHAHSGAPGTLGDLYQPKAGDRGGASHQGGLRGWGLIIHCPTSPDSVQREGSLNDKKKYRKHVANTQKYTVIANCE
uniref:Solute carrier family 35 member F1 n=1 Tax=Oncorhynchus kisutch TaxID=8019 RepID=A0A8C7DVJ5_ONCKI